MWRWLPSWWPRTAAARPAAPSSSWSRSAERRRPGRPHGNAGPGTCCTTYSCSEQRLRRALDHIAARHDRPLPTATPRDEALVAELRRRIGGLVTARGRHPAVRAHLAAVHRAVPRRHEPGGPARLPALADDRQGDVCEQPPLPLDRAAVAPRSARLAAALAAGVRESPVGHPVPFWALPWSSGNLIHHALPPDAVRSADRTPRPIDFLPSSSSAGAMAASKDCFTSWGSRADT